MIQCSRTWTLENDTDFMDVEEEDDDDTIDTELCILSLLCGYCSSVGIMLLIPSSTSTSSISSREFVQLIKGVGLAKMLPDAKSDGLMGTGGSKNSEGGEATKSLHVGMFKGATIMPEVTQSQMKQRFGN